MVMLVGNTSRVAQALYMQSPITLSIYLFLLNFLPSCGQVVQNKIPKDDSNKVVSILPANKPVLLPKDTLQFDNFKKLINFFSKKIDSVDLLRVKVRRDKSLQNSFARPTASMDSTYYNLIKERNNSICKYIVT